MSGLDLTPISSVLDFGGKIIDKLFPDPEQKAKAQATLLQLQQNGELAEIAESVKVVTAEARSDSWLAANWRPITMLTFVVIIANNYIVYPYLSLFWPDAPTLAIPPDMWALLKIGLGGYVVGRSIEKSVKNYKG